MAKIEGFREFLEVASKEIASTAAREITNDLKQRGPYWSGHFEEQWEVKPGNVSIPADSEHPFSPRERWQAHDDNTMPLPRRTTPVQIPQNADQLTIGNRAAYRDIAMDLLPGRVEPGKRNTAKQDWFLTYVQGGGINQALRRATNEVEKSKM